MKYYSGTCNKRTPQSRAGRLIEGGRFIRGSFYRGIAILKVLFCVLKGSQ